MSRRLKPGAKVGPWTVVRHLARGGNGEVYQVTNGSVIGALKLLRSNGLRSDAIERFRIEITTMKACADVPGLMRIVDSQVGATAESCWFVSDFAQKFALKLKKASFEEVLGAIEAIAKTLAVLHERGVAHRDVKPDNLFWCNEAWAVGDLGLASVPDAKHLTRAGTKLGPLHYMAPEMLHDASKADGASADVYSLAKVLWVTATGQRYPMPGHLHRDVAQLRLSSLVSGIAAQRLDALLHATTHPDPKQRPSMRQFLAELGALQKPLVQSDIVVSIRPDFLRELSQRSGLAQRLEQAAAHEQEAKMTARLSNWLVERFRPVINELKDALVPAEGLQLHGGQVVQRGGLDLSSPGGISPAPLGHARYELSVFCSIKRASGPCLDFAFGVCLDVPTTRLEYADGALDLPVDTVPATVVVAYVSGHLRVNVKVDWSMTERFLLNGGHDRDACARLTDGLRGQLEGIVASLLGVASVT